MQDQPPDAQLLATEELFLESFPRFVQHQLIGSTEVNQVSRMGNHRGDVRFCLSGFVQLHFHIRDRRSIPSVGVLREYLHCCTANLRAALEGSVNPATDGHVRTKKKGLVHESRYESRMMQTTGKKAYCILKPAVLYWRVHK